jgi:catechol 2,3-dioxygenase-like lactoylglutathione lyase family enzyme
MVIPGANPPTSHHPIMMELRKGSRRIALMKLNHINLTVTDVPGAVAFLEKYFGMRKQGGDDKFAVLFDDWMMLTLMTVGKGTGVKYPRTFHIGFGQEIEERVNDIYERMIAGGFDVKPPQRSHAWTFYVQAPGGFMVEVLC